MRRPEFSVEELNEHTLEVRTDNASMARHLTQRLSKDNLWTEVVPGLSSVAVMYNPLRVSPDTAVSVLEKQLATLGNTPEENSGPIITIPVRYGGEEGPDLAALATMNNLSTDHLIEQHCSTPHTVEVMGFLPGFAYMSGLPKELIAERLSTPRLRVPKGSVGIANGHSGVYSLPGAGGWPLIGRTDLSLFQDDENNPFLLAPGQRVRFVPQ